MAIYVNTNSAALSAQVSLGRTTNAQSKTFEKLSSGYRINGAADDAANLGIAEKMNAQVRSYSVAERNANDGISLLQTADSAAGSIGDILTRLRELAVQSANGTLNTSDRTNISTEKTSLVSEVDRIANSTKFNGSSVFGSGTSFTFQVGADNTANNRFSVTSGDVTSSGLSVGSLNLNSAGGARDAISSIDSAIKSLATTRESFGSGINRLSAAVSNLQTGRANLATSLSRIRDVDVAEEAANMSKYQVLSQAGAAVLAQANQSPQSALALLR